MLFAVYIGHSVRNYAQMPLLASVGEGLGQLTSTVMVFLACMRLIR